jgi:hypothetical protein
VLRSTYAPIWYAGRTDEHILCRFRSICWCMHAWFICYSYHFAGDASSSSRLSADRVPCYIVILLLLLSLLLRLASVPSYRLFFVSSSLICWWKKSYHWINELKPTIYACLITFHSVLLIVDEDGLAYTCVYRFIVHTYIMSSIQSTERGRRES